jgi:hypothetical protein
VLSWSPLRIWVPVEARPRSSSTLPWQADVDASIRPVDKAGLRRDEMLALQRTGNHASAITDNCQSRLVPVRRGR